MLGQGTKLETNEEMLKVADNTMHFLNARVGVTPQEQGHLKPVGRGYAIATKLACSSVKSFLI